MTEGESPETVTNRLKDSLEQYSALEEKEYIVLRGKAESPEDVLTGIVLQTDVIHRDLNREELRDVIIPILAGEPEEISEDEPYAENPLTLDDESLDAIGVSEEDYGQLRSELIESFERGLRGEIPGPCYASKDVALDYEG